MAGGVFSLAKLFGVTLRESANDGSDFTNPDADYRRLFLGEDGALHLRDSAGTVTRAAGAPTILLDYDQASVADITNLTITGSSTVYVDIISNQNFTKAQAGSLIEVSVRGYGFMNSVSAGGLGGIRVNIDSGGTPITEKISGLIEQTASGRSNLFAGTSSFYKSGLTAAVHTIKLQAIWNETKGFYCRAATEIEEFLRIQVIEHG